jgi:TolB-like protein
LRYLIITVIVSFTFLAASAAVPKRVALLPFKINSAQDLSFLKDGIFDMLSSRLSKSGQVEVLTREQTGAAIQAEAPSGNINESTARRIGTRLKADFVLFGSLTVLGDNVSIDVKMVDISGSKPTMAFFDQSQDLGAVISKINLIAADINDKIFGQPQATTTAKAPAAAAAPAAKPQPPKKSNIYAHPEKVLQEDGFVAHDKGQDIETLGIDSAGERESQARFWRSASFRHLINGVALGDVDGDGKIETVVITPDSVIIFRYEGGTFGRVAEIKENFNKSMIAVDCADINQNGYDEIFVTSLNSGRVLVNSFVLEFDGNNFTKLLDDSRWYYRVSATPRRGKILLCQRPKSGKPSSGAIYEMHWESGDYVPLDRANAPKNTNLLGLALGDVLNNGQETAIFYRESDRMRLIDAAGKTVWDSSDRSGGSMEYYLLPQDDRYQRENKAYYPMRLLVWHNRAKKENEVIAVNNHDLTRRTIEYRYFTKTHIASFSWDGVGLGPNWKTRQITGYIQDFIIGDFDNDGQEELIAALIMKEGRVALITEPKSTLIGYELSAPAQPES